MDRVHHSGIDDTNPKYIEIWVLMPMFHKGAILNPVAAFQKELELAFVTLLKYMGEKLAKYAKDSHNYQDQTGNLTNSIGYAVRYRIRKSFTMVGQTSPERVRKPCRRLQ